MSSTWSIPPLESSVPLPSALAPFPSVQERYYTRFHTRDEASSPAQCVLLHSNRICLVTLGPGHPVVTGEKVVERVIFQVTENLNRLSNEVRGKGNKGGQSVDERSVLCFLECQGGDRLAVRAGVRGRLVEVNERLSREPGLLREKGDTAEGFVAIVMLKIPEGVEDLKSRLQSEEDHRKAEAKEQSEKD